MQNKSSLFGAVALGALVVVAISAAAPAADAATKKHHHKVHHVAPPAGASAEEVHALTEQVQALTAKLQEQEQATQAAQAQAQQAQTAAAEAQASARSAQDQVRAQIDTIPGVVKKDIDADRPLDGKVHLRNNVSLTFGGFAAAESVYRSRNQIADIGSSYSKIPFSNNVVGRTEEWRQTARQSRLSLLAQGDIDPNTHAAFYTELDFLAGAQTGNSNESNSYSPRIRNVYGTLDWDDMGWGGGLHLLAGQNWSLVTMNTKGITPRNELPPPTIDAQYVVGFSWARQPQVRLTADLWDKQLWAAFSVENPQTTFASAATGTSGGTVVSGITVTNNGTPTSQFDNTNTLSLNHVPDIVGKLAYEPNLWGARPLHVEVFGIYRELYNHVSVTSASNVLGLPVGSGNQETDAGGFGAGFTFAAWPKLVDIEGSVMTGKGIGRYGSGQLPDSVVGPSGSLKAIPETMFMGGGTLHVTPNMDFYVFGGEEHQSRVATVIGGKAYGFGSPFANLSGCYTEGAACSPNIQLMSQISGGIWDKVYQGSFGSFRVGVQYSYTELNAFSDGSGLKPKAIDNMIFTSIRYYPF